MRALRRIAAGLRAMTPRAMLATAAGAVVVVIAAIGVITHSHSRPAAAPEHHLKVVRGVPVGHAGLTASGVAGVFADSYAQYINGGPATFNYATSQGARQATAGGRVPRKYRSGPMTVSSLAVSTALYGAQATVTFANTGQRFETTFELGRLKSGWWVTTVIPPDYLSQIHAPFSGKIPAATGQVAMHAAGSQFTTAYVAYRRARGPLPSDVTAGMAKTLRSGQDPLRGLVSRGSTVTVRSVSAGPPTDGVEGEVTVVVAVNGTETTINVLMDRVAGRWLAAAFM